MSFFNVEQAKARLNRSELAVPGSQPQMFEKAAKSAAEYALLLADRQLSLFEFDEPPPKNGTTAAP